MHNQRDNEPALAAVERVVLSTPRVKVAQWRCRPSFHDFHDTGPIRSHLVAFPRTSVRIRHVDGPEFVADATVVTIYNREQRYVREQLHPDGDLCDWWGVDDETAHDIAFAVDPGARGSRGRAFRFAMGRCDARLYLRQRALLHRLHAGGVDALEAEEGVLGIVSDALGSAVRGHGEHVCMSPGTSTPRRALAQSAMAVLSLRYRDSLSLDDLAQTVGSSPFHLCRSFREHTGGTLHAHLNSLRLRAALGQIEQGARDLTGVALDCGFASHSHFSAAFARAFGMSPSAWRYVARHPQLSSTAQPLPRRR